MNSTTTQRSRPILERRFGRPLDPLALNTTSNLGYRELGRVKISCRLRQSKSQWGVLGAAQNPAGVLYIDLSFDQPGGCRLSSATVLVTLEDDDSSNTAFRTSRFLEITDWYGPRQINGEPKTMATKSTITGVPQLTILGSGGGGVGVERETTRTYISRWIFTGFLLPGKDERLNGARGNTAYRTIKWELTENDIDSQAAHSNLFHTGFAFQHDGRPCYLRIVIDGKLQRTRDKIKQTFNFPPRRRKDQGSTLTYINLSQRDQHKVPLDDIAKGLSKALELENYAEIPVEIPDAHPASFREANTDNGQSEDADSPPPANLGRSIQSAELKQSGSGLDSAQVAPFLDATNPAADLLIQMLARALLDSSLSIEPQRHIPISAPVTQSTGTTTTTVKQMSEEDTKKMLQKELDGDQDVLLWLSKSPMLLFLIKLLAKLLNLFSKSAATSESTSSDHADYTEMVRGRGTDRTRPQDSCRSAENSHHSGRSCTS